MLHITSSSHFDEDMTNTHMTKAQAKIDFKAQSTLKSDLFASPVRTAGAGLTKTDAQAIYGLRFGRSIYRWKANGDVGSRSSIRFWITLVVGGARLTDPASDPKTLSNVSQTG